MTSEPEPSRPGREPAGAGCLALVGVFAVTAMAGTLATLALYALVVERLGLISVRREFGFDMVLYAPLAGLICGFAVAFWAIRGGASARRAPVLMGLGLFVVLALLLIFFGLGSVL